MSPELSAESSFMAEIPVLDIINAGICIDAAQKHFAQGDNVRGTLDVANAIPGVNLVSAPVTMELDFAQAGGQIINDSANCGAASSRSTTRWAMWTRRIFTSFDAGGI
ncbi:MAG TPA: hypothetical protein VGC41_23725 [Kofleriaceae bacterium]